MGLELRAELKRGGRFDYMHRAELHGRPGAGVEGVVIEVNPRKKLVHSFEPKFVEDKPSRVTYEIEPMGLVCKLTVTHDQCNEDCGFPSRPRRYTGRLGISI